MTIDTRVKKLHDELQRAHGEGPLVFVAVICNGCGRRVEADSLLQLLPLLGEWKLGDYGEDDFCPSCTPGSRES